MTVHNYCCRNQALCPSTHNHPRCMRSGNRSLIITHSLDQYIQTDSQADSQSHICIYTQYTHIHSKSKCFIDKILSPAYTLRFSFSISGTLSLKHSQSDIIHTASLNVTLWHKIFSWKETPKVSPGWAASFPFLSLSSVLDICCKGMLIYIALLGDVRWCSSYENDY